MPRKSVGEISEDAKKAASFIQSKKNAGELNARLLVSLYREAKRAHFLYGLAELTHIDNDTARDIIERRDIDGLAMICRAANIERPLFVTIAVMTCGGDAAMERAEEFGKLYNAVPIEAATGWKVLSGMSLCAAVEPVAIAMWATAVTDGVTVMFCSATTPRALRRPRPVFRSSTPVFR